MTVPHVPPVVAGDPRGGGVPPRWVRRIDVMPAHVAEVGDSMTLCGEPVRLVNIEHADYPLKCVQCVRKLAGR